MCWWARFLDINVKIKCCTKSFQDLIIPCLSCFTFSLAVRHTYSCNYFSNPVLLANRQFYVNFAFPKKFPSQLIQNCFPTFIIRVQPDSFDLVGFLFFRLGVLRSFNKVYAGKSSSHFWEYRLKICL